MTQSRVALITGVTSQDDAYLFELLLDKGCEVHGVKRLSNLFNTDRMYVEPEAAPNPTARLRCRSDLADDLDLNVDLIVQQPGRDLPIYRIAKRSGMPL